MGVFVELTNKRHGPRSEQLVTIDLCFAFGQVDAQHVRRAEHRVRWRQGLRARRM